jgi:hypothetical protein
MSTNQDEVDEAEAYQDVCIALAQTSADSMVEATNALESSTLNRDTEEYTALLNAVDIAISRASDHLQAAIIARDFYRSLRLNAAN